MHPPFEAAAAFAFMELPHICAQVALMGLKLRVVRDQHVSQKQSIGLLGIVIREHSALFVQESVQLKTF